MLTTLNKLYLKRKYQFVDRWGIIPTVVLLKFLNLFYNYKNDNELIIKFIRTNNKDELYNFIYNRLQLLITSILIYTLTLYRYVIHANSYLYFTHNFKYE